jgi:hypothetical protein
MALRPERKGETKAERASTTEGMSTWTYEWKMGDALDEFLFALHNLTPPKSPTLIENYPGKESTNYDSLSRNLNATKCILNTEIDRTAALNVNV